MDLSMVAGIGLVFLSSYLFLASKKKYKKALASESWPSVSGILLKVDLWGKKLVDGKLEDAERISVVYEYEVNGEKFRSERICFYTLMFPDSFNFAKKNQVKSNVDVYYNPTEPSESVLIKGLKEDKPYSDLFISTTGVIIGIVLSVLSWFDILA